jgi:hypothetical protein
MLKILDLSNNSLTGAHVRSQQAGYECAACQSTRVTNGKMLGLPVLLPMRESAGRARTIYCEDAMRTLGQLQAFNMPYALAAGSLPAAWAAHTNLTSIYLSRNKLAGMHSVTGPLHHPLLQCASVLHWQRTLCVLAACLSTP